MQPSNDGNEQKRLEKEIEIRDQNVEVESMQRWQEFEASVKTGEEEPEIYRQIKGADLETILIQAGFSPSSLSIPFLTYSDNSGYDTATPNDGGYEGNGSDAGSYYADISDAGGYDGGGSDSGGYDSGSSDASGYGGSGSDAGTDGSVV